VEVDLVLLLVEVAILLRSLLVWMRKKKGSSSFFSRLDEKEKELLFVAVS